MTVSQMTIMYLFERGSSLTKETMEWMEENKVDSMLLAYLLDFFATIQLWLEFNEEVVDIRGREVYNNFVHVENNAITHFGNNVISFHFTFFYIFSYTFFVISDVK